MSTYKIKLSFSNKINLYLFEFCKWNEFPASEQLILHADQILGIKNPPLGFGLFMLYFKMNDQFAWIELKKKEYPELFENYRHSIFDFRSIQKQRSKQTGTFLALFLFATIASSFLSWGLLSIIPFQGLLESPACQKDCVDTMHKFFVALLGTYFYPVSSLVLSYFSIRYFSKKYFKVPLRMFVFLSFISYGNFCFQTNKDVFSDKNKVLISHWDKGTLNTNTIKEVRTQFKNPQREAANTIEK